jgi:hypothetical protein
MRKRRIHYYGANSVVQVHPSATRHTWKSGSIPREEKYSAAFFRTPLLKMPLGKAIYGSLKFDTQLKNKRRRRLRKMIEQKMKERGITFQDVRDIYGAK